MGVRDGFIAGIFNYCDRWCERCAFTSHCRLFADHAELEARQDPHHAMIVDAPPLPEEVDPPPPRWMRKLIDEMNEACKQPLSEQDLERFLPRVPPEHEPIEARAKDYMARTYEWLCADETDGADDAREVVAWFHTLIGAKIHRALAVCQDEPDDDIHRSDADGSTKVALIAIERSHASWLNLVERGTLSAKDVEPFISDLVWLEDELDRVRPKARHFIRPGFDEPEAPVGPSLCQRRRSSTSAVRPT